MLDIVGDLSEGVWIVFFPLKSVAFCFGRQLIYQRLVPVKA